MRKIHLLDSIKEGYLRNGYNNNYIVLLDIPLVVSRYNVKNISIKSPEVFMGHHRIGALLALGIDRVRVILAEDEMPGTNQCYGKVHERYKSL
ncbi:MAG: hypothetical protein ACTSSP_06840 [Candidatus Asgardarchaeia archaeon]